MAKFEESDPRWIVQDRVDGTNVHNWHWKEQDCLPWAKQTLQDKFAAVQLFDSGDGVMTAATDGLDSVTGEAFTNIRKNKIIPSYELEIKIGWKGEVKSGNDRNVGGAKGWFHVPYLADENADEKPEVRVVVDGTSQPGPGSCLRQAILVQGLPVSLVQCSDGACGGMLKEMNLFSGNVLCDVVSLMGDVCYFQPVHWFVIECS